MPVFGSGGSTSSPHQARHKNLERQTSKRGRTSEAAEGSSA
jgi:hypothetical protein